MNTKSPLFRSIGALLALLVFVMLPSSTALANCGQCDDVLIYYEYAGPTGIQIEMECDYPAGAIIYFTTNGATPTHDALGNPGPSTSIYYGPMSVAYRTCKYVRAKAWKSCYYDSVNLSYENICNPIQ